MLHPEPRTRMKTKLIGNPWCWMVNTMVSSKFQLIGLRETYMNNSIFHGKMGKSMVSCRFSLRSTHWKLSPRNQPLQKPHIFGPWTTHVPPPLWVKKPCFHRSKVQNPFIIPFYHIFSKNIKVRWDYEILHWMEKSSTCSKPPTKLITIYHH